MASPSKSINSNNVNVDSSEIHGVFDNIITSIKKLVENQVQAVKKKTSKNPKASQVLTIGSSLSDMNYHPGYI